MALKRKREDGDTSQSHFKRGRVRGDAVPDSVSKAQKSVQRTLKLARGFERQKLGRRKKIALKDKKEADGNRIDAEVEALKNLDLSVVARCHIAKMISRDKILNSSQALEAYKSLQDRPPQDTSTTNVIARLYNSNPVKDAVKEATTDLYSSIGEKQTSRKPVSERKGRLGGAKSSEDGRRRTDIKEPGSSESETFYDGGNVAEHDSEDSQELSAEDFAQLDARVAGSGSGSDDDTDEDAPAGTRQGYDRGADLSLSPSPSSEDDASDDGIARPALQTGTGKAGDSKFLPSLTMGGYWSGSDSEDFDDDEARAAAALPRRNRRGQRARQQIWEQKFGPKAKHLQRGSRSRDAGWDPRRGAREEQHGKGYRPGWARVRPAQNPLRHASGGNAVQVIPRERKPKTQAKSAKKGLHPSWEAAKKAKAKKEAIPASITGKKLTFD